MPRASSSRAGGRTRSGSGADQQRAALALTRQNIADRIDALSSSAEAAGVDGAHAVWSLAKALVALSAPVMSERVSSGDEAPPQEERALRSSNIAKSRAERATPRACVRSSKQRQPTQSAAPGRAASLSVVAPRPEHSLALSADRLPVRTKNGPVLVTVGLLFRPSQIRPPGAQLQYDEAGLYFAQQNVPFMGWRRQVFLSSRVVDTEASNVAYVPPGAALRLQGRGAVKDFLASNGYHPDLLAHFDQHPRAFCACLQTCSELDLPRTHVECVAGLGGCGGWVHPACMGIKSRARSVVCPLCTHYLRTVKHSQRHAELLSSARVLTKLYCKRAVPLTYAVVDGMLIEEHLAAHSVWGIAGRFSFAPPAPAGPSSKRPPDQPRSSQGVGGGAAQRGVRGGATIAVATAKDSARAEERTPRASSSMAADQQRAALALTRLNIADGIDALSSSAEAAGVDGAHAVWSLAKALVALSAPVMSERVSPEPPTLPPNHRPLLLDGGGGQTGKAASSAFLSHQLFDGILSVPIHVFNREPSASSRVLPAVDAALENEQAPKRKLAAEAEGEFDDSVIPEERRRRATLEDGSSAVVSVRGGWLTEAYRALDAGLTRGASESRRMKRKVLDGHCIGDDGGGAAVVEQSLQSRCASGDTCGLCMDRLATRGRASRAGSRSRTVVVGAATLAVHSACCLALGRANLFTRHWSDVIRVKNAHTYAREDDLPQCDVCDLRGGLVYYFDLAPGCTVLPAPTSNGWRGHVPCLFWLNRSQLLQKGGGQHTPIHANGEFAEDSDLAVRGILDSVVTRIQQLQPNGVVQPTLRREQRDTANAEEGLDDDPHLIVQSALDSVVAEIQPHESSDKEASFDAAYACWRCAACGSRSGLTVRCASLGCTVRSHFLCASTAGWLVFTTTGSAPGMLCPVHAPPSRALEGAGDWTISGVSQ